jgi:hypothetical protein
MGWVVSKRAKRTLARLLCLVSGLLVCYHFYVRNADQHYDHHLDSGLNERARGYGNVGSGSDGKADTMAGGSSSRVKVRSSVPPTSPWEGRRVAIVEFAPYHEGEFGRVYSHLLERFIARPTFLFSCLSISLFWSHRGLGSGHPLVPAFGSEHYLIPYVRRYFRLSL